MKTGRGRWPSGPVEWFILVVMLAAFAWLSYVPSSVRNLLSTFEGALRLPAGATHVELSRGRARPYFVASFEHDADCAIVASQLNDALRAMDFAADLALDKDKDIPPANFRWRREGFCAELLCPQGDMQFVFSIGWNRFRRWAC